MAKKPHSTKKSRFGNPAKAAADAATRANAVPLADLRLERAMEAIAPGFALWLESQGRDVASVDITLMILDDFFDMYRILEPVTDPMSLLPDAVREVMEVSADANPQASFALRAGVQDYVDYLAQSALWTGAPGDLTKLADLFKQPAWPGLAPGAELRLDGPLAAGETFDGAGANDGAGVEFASIFVPELSAELFTATAAASPLWKNTLALLAWVGDGQDTSLKGQLRKKDRADAAATLRHTGAGNLGDASLSSATDTELAAETMDRLKLYWHLLSSLGLVQFKAGRASIAPRGRDFLEQAGVPFEVFRDLLGQFISISTLTGSEPGLYEDWHFEMASFMVLCASENPPTPEALVSALESPDAANLELFILAKNVASWAAEGLVTVGEHVEVPPAFRLDLAEILRGDFDVVSTGPGAGLDVDELLHGG